jgi:hypothetical protein
VSGFYVSGVNGCNDWKKTKDHKCTNTGRLRTTQIMMAALPLRRLCFTSFQFYAAWFLLDWVYSDFKWRTLEKDRGNRDIHTDKETRKWTWIGHALRSVHRARWMGPEVMYRKIWILWQFLKHHTKMANLVYCTAWLTLPRLCWIYKGRLFAYHHHRHHHLC